ncbi:lysylphosphatidylglycerol synthase domain-containing protein [Solicola sp. PLA-1-18]|uniref:lysylphosphatidylglycerol synthase domain-containing protein n=1 Tax=Solicola sp. PLA-1-18 TaxID=3380532 RepID=UPI003B7EC3B7
MSPLHAAEVPPAPGAGRSTRAPRLVVGLALTAAAAALVVMVPRLVHVSWTSVLTTLATVSLGWLAVLAVVWLAGMWAHTLVLTSSMPGLSSRRALGLNLAGSAVANSVPLGGAVSMGLTTAMARSWGFARVELATFLTVSNVWNLLFRALFGAFALAFLLTGLPHGAVASAAPVALGAAVLVVVTIVLLLARERWAALLGRGAGTLADLVHRLRGGEPGDLAGAGARGAVEVRATTLRVIGSSWHQMSVGMVVYLSLLCLLLDLCLHAIGTPVPVATVVAAVAVERLLSAVPVTPGGAGVAELGIVAVLTLSGTAPLAAASAAVLYRLFTFALEIPVGLGVAAGWGALRWRRHHVREQVAA